MFKVRQKGRIILITESLEEKLSNPDILEVIGVDIQSAFENSEYLPGSELAEGKDVACEKVGLLLHKRLPSHQLFPFAGDVSCCTNRGFPSTHAELFCEKFPRDELPLQLEQSRRIFKGKHHTAFKAGTYQNSKNIFEDTYRNMKKEIEGM